MHEETAQFSELLDRLNIVLESLPFFSDDNQSDDNHSSHTLKEIKLALSKEYSLDKIAFSPISANYLAFFNGDERGIINKYTLEGLVYSAIGDEYRLSLLKSHISESQDSEKLYKDYTVEGLSIKKIFRFDPDPIPLEKQFVTEDFLPLFSNPEYFSNHLIIAPPNAGKTFNLINALKEANRKFIFLVPLKLQTIQLAGDHNLHCINSDANSYTI